MNTTIEKPQGIPFTKEQMAEFFRSDEGQQLLRQSRLPQSVKKRPAMSEAEQDKYCKLAEKMDINYVRIDPTSKKAITEEKGEETFWRIINVIPEAVGNSEAEARISFYIRRYWKHRTYKRSISPTDATQVEEHEPWVIRATNRWTKMYSLVEVGDRIIDAEDFMQQFKRDED